MTKSGLLKRSVLYQYIRPSWLFLKYSKVDIRFDEVSCICWYTVAGLKDPGAEGKVGGGTYEAFPDWPKLTLDCAVLGGLL